MKLICPTKSCCILQAFGDHPEWYKPFGLPGHEGLDFIGVEGDNVYACADGTVYMLQENDGKHPYGTHVRISHEADKYKTTYAHLSEILVSKGESVKAGQVIGKVGWTGNCMPKSPAGAHLHLNLKIDGEKTPGYPDGIIDPYPYIIFEDDNVPIESQVPSIALILTILEEMNVRVDANTNCDIITTVPIDTSLVVKELWALTELGWIAVYYDKQNLGKLHA